MQCLLICPEFAAKLTPVPKLPDRLSSDTTASGGKRKRKIQLVSGHGDEQISLVLTHTTQLKYR